MRCRRRSIEDVSPKVACTKRAAARAREYQLIWCSTVVRLAQLIYQEPRNWHRATLVGLRRSRCQLKGAATTGVYFLDVARQG